MLDARERYPTSTLAQMYDPNLMPADLRAAHNALDRAVEAAYGLKGGTTSAQRVAKLLELYQALAPTLMQLESKKVVRRRKADLSPSA